MSQADTAARYRRIRHGMRAASDRGFSLIEVMIVVAIIGIVAAIAYPSYGDYVQQTRRADAHLSLLSAVQALERCKSTQYSYSNCVLNDTTSSEDYYNLALTKTATTYTLTATPVTGKSQAGDTDCASITINHIDQRLPAECWD